MAMPPSAFDPATAYLVAGFLYVVMPLAAWFVMGKGRTQAAGVWCLGSGLLGVATLLLAFRSEWPGWLAFGGLNAAFYAGNLLHVMALRQEMRQPSGWRWALLACLVLVAVQEYLRLYSDSAILRFAWVVLGLGFLLGLTSWLAWQLHLKEGSQSLRWLARVYAFGAVAFFIRLSLVLWGVTAPQPMSMSWDSVLTTFSLFVMAVFGSVAILGLYLERSMRQDVAREVAMEQQQANLVFGQQMAHLDRQRSLGELAAAMAHEVAQPLTAVSIECGALQYSLDEEHAGFRSQIESINQHVDRAANILKGIRNFIQPAEPDFKPVNLLVVVRDVLQLLLLNGQEKNIRIQTRTDILEPRVMGDFVQLSQVLLNLLRNAMQAQIPGQTLNIVIDLKPVGQRLHLSVEDDGTGFAQHVLTSNELAFASTKREGMGIGLSISRRIALQHGGALVVGNRAGVRGARVLLDLPVCM